MDLPIKRHRSGVTLAVRAVPGARASALTGVVPRADGACALKVAVTAAPQDGKANQAIIALLSKTWRIPKFAFTILSGETGRDKVFLIAGDPETLMHDLAARLSP